MKESIKFFWWEVKPQKIYGHEIYLLQNELFYINIRKDNSIFSEGDSWLCDFKLFCNGEVVYHTPFAQSPCNSAREVAEQLEINLSKLFGSLFLVCT